MEATYSFFIKEEDETGSRSASRFRKRRGRSRSTRSTLKDLYCGPNQEYCRRNSGWKPASNDKVAGAEIKTHLIEFTVR